MSTIETRFVTNDLEVRSDASGKPVFNGYAAVYDAVSQNLGGFVETVTRSAFTKTIKEADVRAYLNHDKNLILGRTASGTLKLSEDERGLYYEVTSPDTSYARDLLISIERGDVNQSSFAFSVVGKAGESWRQLEDGTLLRELREVRLYDVSPVTLPAYEAATVGVSQRSVEGLALAQDIDLALVAHLAPIDAVRALLEGSDELLAPQADADEHTEPADEHEPQARKLSVARNRLAILEATAHKI